MTKNFGPSTFFASDKSIFDALMQKKIPQNKLLDFLRQRGILLSDKAERNEIAIYISRTFIDYYDLQKISSFLEGGQKKQKTTNSIVEAEITSDEVISACQSLKEVMDKAGDTCKISKLGHTTKVSVTYDEVDLSKTELRQRSTKTVNIEVTRTDQGISIRQPANLKAQSVSAAIIDNLSELKEQELKPQLISLINIQEPEARSFFGCISTLR